MYSMTGYGKANLTIDNKEMVIELKSVNHRFLDINIKLPKILASVEDVIRKTIQKDVSRGRVDVFVSFQDKGSDGVSFVLDQSVAKAYYEVSRQMLELLDVQDDLKLTTLMKVPDVLRQEIKEVDGEFLAGLATKTCAQAVCALNKMRKIEGDKLAQDILERITVMRGYLAKVEELAPLVAVSYREKLTQRMSDILAEIEIDQNKLINEVAFYADKSNIDEEITRLKSHFDQGENILNNEELVGRKLDFLIQEFNREVNTICSKSNDVSLTNVALLLKSEVEKVREQVQNLE